MSKAPVFITGISRGLGAGLVRHYLREGNPVYGVSRSGWQGELPQPAGALHEAKADLSQFDEIDNTLAGLLNGVEHLQLVVLSAGILGGIQDLADTSLAQIREVMDINVWANKCILDGLLRSSIQIEQIVLISSGAAVNGNRGWGAYGLSKAALNMLTQLYAHEFVNTHLSAFAPGLVDTGMQDYLCDEVDTVKFPSVANIKAARDTGFMPTPDEMAGPMAEAFLRLREKPSGGFFDIRGM